MSIARPLAAGTVLSTAAVSALAAFDPGPAEIPGLSWRHPWAAYLALAAAPLGNGLELFVLVAAVFATCLLVSGWLNARRTAREVPED